MVVGLGAVGGVGGGVTGGVWGVLGAVRSGLVVMVCEVACIYVWGLWGGGAGAVYWSWLGLSCIGIDGTCV